MIGALIIVFREVIEAGLVVGIVLAATRGVPQRGMYVAMGIMVGVIGASAVAGFAGGISEAFEGSGQELLNATILLAAVAMLMWHNAWMARHGRELAAEMRKVGAAVTAGDRPLVALALVVGVAVLREGSEVVLFLAGVAAAGTSAPSLIGGGVLGLAAGVGVAVLTYGGLLTVPSRYIFAVTSVLIALLAAGMASSAVQYLNAAGVLTLLDGRLWDTSAWLPEGGWIGRILRALVGYSERPTELQLIAYAATLVGMALLMWVAAGTRRRVAR